MGFDVSPFSYSYPVSVIPTGNTALWSVHEVFSNSSIMWLLKKLFTVIPDNFT